MRFETGGIIAERYTLARCIGEGGMGAVWAARDQREQQLVALKILRGEATSPELRRRFLREARAAMAVKHPNVVRIREVVTVEDEPIIVMDYLEGESLARRLENLRQLPLADFARIFVPVVSAIGTAHAAGIVHRDLKPDNIFLTRLPDGSEEPRVVDFGIAKLTAIDGDAKQSGELTTSGSVLGTPYYMSPEQVFGDKSIDHRSDVWSLGTIAFECLSGRRPVDGENIGQLLKVITTGAIPRLEAVVQGLPPDIYELVNRMLSYDRGKRPYDLREVLNVFSRHTDRQAQSFGEVTLAPGTPIPSGEPAVSPSAQTMVDVPNTGPNEARPPSGMSTTGGAAVSALDARTGRPPRSGRGAAVAVAAVVGVLALGGAAFGLRAKLTAGGSSVPASPTTAASSVLVAPDPSPPAPVVSSVASQETSAPPPSAASSVRPKPNGPQRPVAPKPSTTASSEPNTAITPPVKPTASGAPVATQNPYQ
jgi:serine/threonine protein kinase